MFHVFSDYAAFSLQVLDTAQLELLLNESVNLLPLFVEISENENLSVYPRLSLYLVNKSMS